MITLIERAADEIRRVITEKAFSDQMHVRIGVKNGGCSGFEYSFGFDDNVDIAKDHVTEQHGVRVAVDKMSDLYLDGTTIDFVDELQRRGFKFENPNAVKSCGCGSSFSA